MKLAPLVVAASLALATFVPAATAHADEAGDASPTAARDRFAGNFAYGGGAAQDKAREDAIEKATDSMFFATRGIARGRLKDKTVIRQQIGISFGGGNITTTFSSLPAAVSPENGSPAPYKSGDDTVQLTQKITPDGKLVQSFTASDGNRTNTYSLSADGKTLTMAVVVTSTKIPQPVRYMLTYVRR